MLEMPQNRAQILPICVQPAEAALLCFYSEGMHVWTFLLGLGFKKQATRIVWVCGSLTGLALPSAVGMGSFSSARPPWLSHLKSSWWGCRSCGDRAVSHMGSQVLFHVLPDDSS